MTTIAYRNGVLAADTALSYGCMLGGATKIVRCAEGVLAGAAGTGGYNTAFLQWAAHTPRDTEPPKAKRLEDIMDRGVLFFPDGLVQIFEEDGLYECRPPYYAFGSGKAEALGAMFAGADAETAVRAAIEHDPHTGGAVLCLTH
jgi:hypothetical protein